MKLSFRLNGLFVQGGEVEGDAKLVVYGNTEGLRDTIVLPNTAPAANFATFVGDMEGTTKKATWLSTQITLPLPAKIEDKVIDVGLIVATSERGVPSLKEPIKGDLDSGNGQVSLAALLGAPNGTVTVPIIDDILYKEFMRRAITNASGGNAAAFNNPTLFINNEKMKKINDLAFTLAAKANISVKLEWPREMNAVVENYRRKLQNVAPNPVTTGKLLAQGNQLLEHLEYTYWVRNTDLPPPPNVSDEMLKEKRIPSDSRSPLLKQLFMSRYSTPIADVPPIAFVLQDRAFRGDTKLDANGVAYIKSLLMSSLLAHGMRPSHFAAVVNEQMAEKGDKLRSSFLTAMKVVGHIGTFLATQINYMADYRLGNVVFYESLSAEDKALFAPIAQPTPPAETKASRKTNFDFLERFVDQKKAAVMRQHLVEGQAFNMILQTHLEKAGFRRRPWAFSDDTKTGGGGGGGVESQNPMLVQCESWRNALVDTKLTGDCEDVAGLITQGLAALNVLLQKNEFKDPSLLALRSVMNLMTPSMIGGTVSEPFVDTRAATSSTTPTPPAHKPLPIVGSPEESRFFAGEGGHGYAVYESKCSLGRRFLTGIGKMGKYGAAHPEDRSTVESGWRKAVDTAPLWMQRLPALVLEGTGAVDPFILPAAEVYKNTDREKIFVAKSKAQIEFTRALRLSTLNKEANALKTIAEIARIETAPYEHEARMNPEQHTSTFYKSVAHLLNVDEYLAGRETTAQSIVASPVRMERGVPIATYLSDSMRYNKDSPLTATVAVMGADMSLGQYRASVGQFIEQVNDLLPSSSFARSRLPSSQQIANPLPPGTLQHLSGLPIAPAALTQHFDGLYKQSEMHSVPLAEKTDGSGTQADSFGLIETADARDDISLVRLSVPAWKFATMSQSDITRFQTAFEQLKQEKQILGYAMTREHVLSQCHDSIRILLAIPVHM